MDLPEHFKSALENSEIKDEIVSFLFYGSAKTKTDFNQNSDYDFHLLLKQYNSNNLSQIKDIFSGHSKIDLSLQSLEEIYKDDKIIFQNGTQGIYFAYVLNTADVLIGKNFYQDMLKKISIIEIEKSIKFKLREYDWRIRRYLLSEKDIDKFQKYVIRILKDILCLLHPLKLNKILNLSSHNIVNMFIKHKNNQLSHHDIELIKQIFSLNKTDINQNYLNEVYILIHKLVIEQI